jgi:hypothetical protein
MKKPVILIRTGGKSEEEIERELRAAAEKLERAIKQSVKSDTRKPGRKNKGGKKNG